MLCPLLFPSKKISIHLSRGGGGQHSILLSIYCRGSNGVPDYIGQESGVTYLTTVWGGGKGDHCHLRVEFSLATGRSSMGGI